METVTKQTEVFGVRLNYTLTWTGDGLMVSLTGGDHPHLGATAQATPRASLTGQGLSADVSVLVRPGHKDDELARIIARDLASALDEPVVVAAGIHIHRATPEEIRSLQEAVPMIVEKLLADVRLMKREALD